MEGTATVNKGTATTLTCNPVEAASSYSWKKVFYFSLLEAYSLKPGRKSDVQYNRKLRLLFFLDFIDHVQTYTLDVPGTWFLHGN